MDIKAIGTWAQRVAAATPTALAQAARALEERGEQALAAARMLDRAMQFVGVAGEVVDAVRDGRLKISVEPRDAPRPPVRR